jgi:hypothetical protein
MRRRYGWWLLGAGMLATVAGVVGLVFIFVPRPPQEAVDLFEKPQLGMDRIEVEELTGLPPRFASEPQWSIGEKVFADHWRLCVQLGDEGEEDGKLIEKELVPPQRTPGWRRAWYELQQRLPALPDLPF